MNALRIAGYAALFGVADAGRDTILPGAFRETLRARRTPEERELAEIDLVAVSVVTHPLQHGARLRLHPCPSILASRQHPMAGWRLNGRAGLVAAGAGARGARFHSSKRAKFTKSVRDQSMHRSRCGKPRRLRSRSPDPNGPFSPQLCRAGSYGFDRSALSPDPAHSR